MDIFPFKRHCPKCSKEIFYSRKDSLKRAETQNRLCSSCMQLGDRNHFYGKYHTYESKKKNLDKHIGKKHSPSSIDKMILSVEKTKYQRKSYILPNGETIKVQGYEPWTLDKLIKKEHTPIENIKIKTLDKPKIKYNFNGKYMWYYPDCYLSNSNTIVETKSNYTWSADLERNRAKLNAAKKEGYNVRLIVWNKKQEEIQHLYE